MENIILTQILTEIKDMRGDMAEMKTDISAMKTDILELKTDVAELKTDVAALQVGQAKLEADMADVRQDITMIMVTQENIIQPQIQLLAEGHSDIVRELKKLGRIDRMEDDISDLKAAVRFRP